MKVAISSVRPFHISMMAEAFSRHAEQVDIYTSAPRRFFGKLPPRVKTHLVPSPVEVASKFIKLPHKASLYGITLWDPMVGLAMGRPDLAVGLATTCLSSARIARKRGVRFALDRACPHVDFQQELVRAEAEEVGSRFTPEPAWFRERQLAEYDVASVIVTPSDYTARSFPAGLREKVVIAPLLGRPTAKGEVRIARNTPFTVGVLGGHPLRKGYLYLLEAWKRLKLPQARLLIRSSGNFAEYPRLQELLRELPNVEILDYIPNIAEFYQGCDAFVLPSVDDGFGMALFEAMANGVPSIATTHCGASELLVNGRDGLVIPPRDVDALAASLLRFYEDEAFRQEIAVRGREAVERVTGERVYEVALTSVLHGGSAPPAAPMLQHA